MKKFMISFRYQIQKIMQLNIYILKLDQECILFLLYKKINRKKYKKYKKKRVFGDQYLVKNKNKNHYQ